jgi:hypothetical protein
VITLRPARVLGDLWFFYARYYGMVHMSPQLLVTVLECFVNDATAGGSVKPKPKRRAKSRDTIDAEMAKVATDLAKIEATARQLRERQKTLQVMREQQGAKRLAEAILKHSFGDVSASQATTLAKRLAALGITVVLEKLG